VRVERGIYRQANGKYVLCFMLDGKPWFRTVGSGSRAGAGAATVVRAGRTVGVVAAGAGRRLEMVAGCGCEMFLHGRSWHLRDVDS
jgi:hypothetical protein